jgi:multicomponent Na+:H+ antiporter subunit D
MTAFAIAGFGLIGTPGTAGFISKWYLALGALSLGGWPLLLVIVASSMIAIIYVGRVVEIMWFRDEAPAVAEAREAPVTMLVPILVLAAATIYFGIDTRVTAGVAGQAAEMLIGGLRLARSPARSGSWSLQSRCRFWARSRSRCSTAGRTCARA